MPSSPEYPEESAVDRDRLGFGGVAVRPRLVATLFGFEFLNLGAYMIRSVNFQLDLLIMALVGSGFCDISHRGDAPGIAPWNKNLNPS